MVVTLSKITLLVLALPFSLSALSLSNGQSQTPLDTSTLRCDCTNTNDTGPTGRTYICRDPRLGPTRLPRRFPLLGLVSDYDRFGGLTPGQFLEKWAPGGRYAYPPSNGFQLDVEGKPIAAKMVLLPGTTLDRFGSEYGTFVSAADAPYDQRALPPSNLATNPDAPDYPYNYHIYEVKQELTVLGGPIAPWFGQSGLGAQFYVGDTGNIKKLIELGLLEKLNKSAIDVGPGRGNRCG